MLAKNVILSFFLTFSVWPTAVLEIHFRQQSVTLYGNNSNNENETEIITADQNIYVSSQQTSIALRQSGGYLFLKNRSHWLYFVCWGNIDFTIRMAAIELKLWEGNCIPSTTNVIYERLVLASWAFEETPTQARYYSWHLPEQQKPTAVPRNQNPSIYLDCEAFKRFSVQRSETLYALYYGRWRKLDQISDGYSFYVTKVQGKTYYANCR